MEAVEEDEIAEIEAWFATRGFALELEREEENLYWANLARIDDGLVVVPLYGRGTSPLEAARRARDRFGIEQ